MPSSYDVRVALRYSGSLASDGLYVAQAHPYCVCTIAGSVMQNSKIPANGDAANAGVGVEREGPVQSQ